MAEFDWIYYFAYGSNMSSVRLRARVPGARSLGRAELTGWRLRFNKHGRDGTAKANIEPAPGARVWGVLYALPRHQRGTLDEAEDLGRGYAEHWVDVVHAEFGQVLAMTYVGLVINPGLPVPGWYLQHCLDGVAEHGLPAAYASWVRREASAATAVP
jgi:cation transport regulator ChaC